jgi:hypothetical protein
LELALKNGVFMMFGNGLVNCLIALRDLSTFAYLILHKLVLAELFGQISQSQENLVILMAYIYAEDSEVRYACFYPWIRSLLVTRQFLQAVMVVPTNSIEIAKDILATARKQAAFEGELVALLQMYENEGLEKHSHTNMAHADALDLETMLKVRREITQQNYDLIQNLLAQL